MFNLESLQNHPLLCSVEVHPTIDSTNTRAMERAAETDLELPLLVTCERQTAGRGRGRNQWHATDGSLTFSLLLDFAQHGLPREKLPQLSVATAVAVVDTLAEQVGMHGLGIKWPNDVWYERRKIAGILLEVPPENRSRLVVGIGVNANNSIADAPSEIRQKAISCIDIAERPIDLTELLLRFCDAFTSVIRNLVSDAEKLARRWQQLDLLAGAAVSVATGEQTRSGKVIGISDDGGLRIRDAAAESVLYGGVVENIAWPDK